MPLNEAKGPTVKPRWPMEFDLAGIERDSDVREEKLNSIREGEHAPMPESKDNTWFDPNLPIANPGARTYQPYPRMLYNAKGESMVVQSAEEERAANRKNYFRDKKSAE